MSSFSRDQSERHHQLLVQRDVPEEAVTRWETMIDAIECSPTTSHLPPWAFVWFFAGRSDAYSRILPPPPWAYAPYGSLESTPLLPGQPGYVPQPVTADDLLELKLILGYV
ncbi:hypothetical protein [Spirosoma sordidisoli]|uniref:Uncharacterized protein n=1 Tax=Spirosoma sordidisoli TaxID=2502893 RepID=A0A4Q2UPD2_9BACT|nr:hypothetical protein [Spirosoma sordidisoli]RYC70742.1 hypothetical protein EQG79_00890 [Spirosoma sordidisoli]